MLLSLLCFHPDLNDLKCGLSIVDPCLPLPPDSYSEVVPTDGPPSFRGQAVKYVYKLTIGCQRVNSPIKLLRVPFRVLVLQGASASPAGPGPQASRSLRD